VVTDAKQYKVTFNNNTSNQTGTSFTPSSDLTEGEHTISVIAVDEAGNESEAGTHTVVIDTTAPSVPSISATSPTTDTTPTWNWNSVTDAVEYDVKLNEVSKGSQTETSYTASTLTDGTHTISVRAKDALGNTSDWGEHTIEIISKWTQIGSDIGGEEPGDLSGFSVSLNSDGTIVAIGAQSNDDKAKNSGHVRVYQNIENTWTQIGSDIVGEKSADWSGRSVSLNSAGNIVAIGAHGNDASGLRSGHVRVYQYQNIENTWTKIGSDIDGEKQDDNSGFSVSLNSDGTIVAIGARTNDDNESNSGHVRVYKNVSGTWTQIGSDIIGEKKSDYSGHSVSLNSNGNIVAIGAPYNDANNIDVASNFGHVRVYKNIGETWTQIGTDIDGKASNDQSGGAVSLNSAGNIVAIGAIGNDDAGDLTGHVRVFMIN